MKLNDIAQILLFVLIVIGSCTTDEDLMVTSEEASNKDSDVIVKVDENSNKPGDERIVTVELGTAKDFAILSKSGITNVPPSAITGNVGTSPITGAALLLTCPQVSGTIYSVDAAGPLACRVTDAPGLGIAVGDMQTAYTDAAGRSIPNYLNLGAGTIGGRTLLPGLYKFTSAVNIPTDITISGSPNDIWIFQVAGTLTMSSAVRMTLEGGAQASNIFWQVSGAVTLGTTSHFEGNLLGATSIAVQTGATVNGRLLAQTAVTLQMNTVTVPAEKVEVPCVKTNLNLYAPFTSFATGTDTNNNVYVFLYRALGDLRIYYDELNAKWVLSVYSEGFSCLSPYSACNDPGSCDFTISSEEIDDLIDDALALGLGL
jgi:hypothetical protein